MPSLQISALGSPEVRLDHERVAVKPKKAMALLIYLAASQRMHSRDVLATLLWPDSGQRQARAALRRRLSELTGAIGDGWLLTEGEAVGLHADGDLWFDLRCFEQELGACRTHGHAVQEVCPACQKRLESAVELYRDDFLAGFTLSDCPEFDDWQFFQTESLRQELASALERLVGLYSGQGDPAAAIPYARRWISLDPLHESAHRALMRVYADAGQRSAALRQYELCVHTLDAEMGVAPDAETNDLYESIRTLRTSAPDAVQGAQRLQARQPVTPIDEPAPRDEVRMATVLVLDVDAADEEDWDRRSDEIAGRIAAFLQDTHAMLERYEATLAHRHDSGLQAIFGLPELCMRTTANAQYTPRLPCRRRLVGRNWR